MVFGRRYLYLLEKEICESQEKKYISVCVLEENKVSPKETRQ